MTQTAAASLPASVHEADSHKTFEAALADIGASEIPLPWPSLEAILQGPLLPGVYAIHGAAGVGRTQLLAQWTLFTARATVPALWLVADARPLEIAARLAGLASAEPWFRLMFGTARESLRTQAEDLLAAELPLYLTQPPCSAVTEATVRQCVRLRQTVHPSGPMLVAVDTAWHRTPRFLAEAKRLVCTHAVTILVLPPAGPGHDLAVPVDGCLRLEPVDDVGQSPSEISVGQTNRSTAVRLFVDKWKSGVTGSIVLRFDGARFEEDPEEIDLVLTDL